MNLIIFSNIINDKYAEVLGYGLVSHALGAKHLDRAGEERLKMCKLFLSLYKVKFFNFESFMMVNIGDGEYIV